MCLITDPRGMPKTHPLVTGGVDLGVLKKFTYMQIICLGIMWWVKGSPAAMLFPSSSPRSAPSHRWARLAEFSQDELNLLDESRDRPLRQGVGRRRHRFTITA